MQKKFSELKSQLELKSYDLSLFQGRAEQSEHHKVRSCCLSQRTGTHAKHMWVFSQSNISVLPSLVGYRGQLAEVVATMTAELENEQAELVKKEEEHNECVKTAATLSETISNYGRDRESRLLALEKEIKSLKKEVASVSKEFKVSDQQPLVYRCYVYML